MARLGASAVNCPVSTILPDVSKRSHRLAAMLQVAGCRGPGDSGAACMLEWGKERGVLSSLSYHRAPSVTRHARSIAGTSELTSTSGKPSAWNFDQLGQRPNMNGQHRQEGLGVQGAAAGAALRLGAITRVCLLLGCCYDRR